MILPSSGTAMAFTEPAVDVLCGEEETFQRDGLSVALSHSLLRFYLSEWRATLNQVFCCG